MSDVFVPPSGPSPCDVMIVGERPGHVEARRKIPFVGDSGFELFGGFAADDEYHVGHWARIVGIPRTEVRVTNVVPTFRAGENPEPWELAKWAAWVDRDVRRTAPKVIVTFGAFAMRHFLGDKPMDLVNGIPHPLDHGRVLIPVIHPARALREPESQPDLVYGLRQVRRVLEGTLAPPQAPPKDYRRVSLQHFLGMARGNVIDVDTEGSEAHPECVTFAHRHWAAIWYCADVENRGLVQDIFDTCRSATFHWTVNDMHVCHAAGVYPRAVDDTMVMAFCADEAQALKDAVYRRFGIDTPSFADLVRPYDDARITSAIREWRRALKSSEAYGETYQPLSPKTGKPLKPRPTDRAKALQTLLNKLAKFLTVEHDYRGRWTRSKMAALRPPPPPVTWIDLPQDIREPYALDDAWWTGHLRRSLAQDLKTQQTARIHQIDRDTLPFLHAMEAHGMRIDVEGLRDCSTRLEREHAAVLARIERLVGRPVNPDAHEDVSDLLFGELRVTPTKRTKGKGTWTTEDKYLQARRDEHPVIPLILDGRSLWKYKATFCDGIIDACIYEDATSYYILYPNIKYTRVVSGRLSATDPNVFAIPKHSIWGKRIRRRFIARDGKVLLSMDLSQIELRIAAHESKDPKLCEAFLNGEDLHAKTAHEVLGAPKGKENQDESLHRLPSKTTNFSILMGTTEYGLADSINAALAVANPTKRAGIDYKVWSTEEAADLIEGWYRVYRGVHAFNQRKLQEARRTDYVTDMWGRRRYVGGVNSSNKWIRESAEREVQSYPYQAGAKGLMKRWETAMYQQIVAPESPRIAPWLDVHDDAIFEVDNDPRIVDDLSIRCRALLPQALRVPVKADAKTGLTWGDVHG